MAENDNNKSNIGYGKLLGYKCGEIVDYFVAGMNPSRVRFENLKYPFDSDFGSGTKNVGAIFMKVLQAIGIYDKCYITNLVKCSSPDNKVKTEHFNSCLNHFKKELELHNPKAIIACGNQVYDFLQKNLHWYYPVEKIYHPNYCFSYHRLTEKEYLFHVKEVFDIWK